MPVLPLVGSTTAPPGCELPARLGVLDHREADAVLDRAAGVHAARPWPQTRPRGVSASSRRISKSGVSPTRSSTLSTTSGCEGERGGQWGSIRSDHVARCARASARRAPDRLAARADVGDGDRVEAPLDGARQGRGTTAAVASGRCARPARRPLRAQRDQATGPSSARRTSPSVISAAGGRAGSRRAGRASRR